MSHAESTSKRQGLAQDLARLRALINHRILDTAPTPEFDALVRTAAEACGTPIALVSFVDGHRQWFKARIGFELQETALDKSICATAIEFNEVFVVPDAQNDPRVNWNSLVWGEPHIAFYAGAPLIDGGGHPLGMICVLDTKPRPTGLTADQLGALTVLAATAISLIEGCAFSELGSRPTERLRRSHEDLCKMKTPRGRDRDYGPGRQR